MVRTAAEAVRVGGKSSRKTAGAAAANAAAAAGNAAPSSARKRSPSSTATDRSAGGLNPICPRETPSWQKPITNFFTITTGKSSTDSQSNDNSTVENPSTTDVNMADLDEVDKSDIENRPNNVQQDVEMEGFTRIGKRRSTTELDGEMVHKKRFKLVEN